MMKERINSRICFFELKKIFRPIPIIVVAWLVVLYAVTFGSVSFSSFVVHEPADFVAVAADMTERYGPTLDDEERADAESTLLSEYEAEIAEAIRSNPLFAAADVKNYEDYLALQGRAFPGEKGVTTSDDGVSTDLVTGVEVETLDMEQMEIQEETAWESLTPPQKELLESDFMGSVFGFANSKARCLEELLLPSYDNLDNHYKTEMSEPFIMTEQETVRYQEIHAAGEDKSTMPQDVVSSVNHLAAILAILLIAVVCILFAPVITRDNTAGIRHLQNTSKIGRKIMRRQLVVMMISAFALTTLVLFVAGVFSIQNYYAPFLDCGVDSTFAYSAGGHHWFSTTLSGYMGCLAALIYGLVFAATLIVFFLSKNSSNFISLLLKLIPAAALLSGAAYAILIETFAFRSVDSRGISSLIPIPHIEVYAVIFLIALGALITGISLRRYRRSDMV